MTDYPPGPSMCVTVRSCQRCGQDHEDLRFTGLDNAVDNYNWWATCPTMGQPVLLKVTVAQPAATNEAPVSAPLNEWQAAQRFIEAQECLNRIRPRETLADITRIWTDDQSAASRQVGHALEAWLTLRAGE